MSHQLTADDVLRRYQSEDLPEFSEIDLRDVNQVGNFGNRPIHVACTRGNIDEVTALLKGGADINAVGDLGATPLHDAVGQSHVEVVKLLLQAGALQNRKNELDATALEVALMKGRGDIADLLRAAAK